MQHQLITKVCNSYKFNIKGNLPPFYALYCSLQSHLHHVFLASPSPSFSFSFIFLLVSFLLSEDSLDTTNQSGTSNRKAADKCNNNTRGISSYASYCSFHPSISNLILYSFDFVVLFLFLYSFISGNLYGLRGPGCCTGE